MDARATYAAGREAAGHAVRRSEARAGAIGVGRVVVVLALVALVAAIVWVPLAPSAWAGVAALAVAFIVLVAVHARVYRRKELALATLRFHERGQARLEGRWDAFSSTGARFLTADHAYAEDLDVFGAASIFQLIDATETRFGEERLAAWLAGASGGSWPELHERQAAVRDLAGRVAFRERLSALGTLLGAAKPDPAPFLSWAEGAMPLGASLAVRWVARALPALVIVGLAFGPKVGTPRAFWLVGVLVEIGILAGVRDKTSAIVGAVSSREQSLASYGDLFAAVLAEPFEAPLLCALQARLRVSGADATREMAALARIVGFVDARLNEVFRLFIAPVLLWDLNCALALERWRLRVGKGLRGWFEALGELEALASLAGFAFERPDHAWPELVDAPAFVAVALGHPLIAADRRVTNDLSLPSAGQALVVTGSNMSGKSTLLRAVGLNAVLALSGAPVCARSLSLGPVTVHTSMRVRDSLAEGVSRFYAELRKLKSLIDRCRAGPGVLFLLDEILHGTNSRERLIGARAIMRDLLAHGALGAVSTHDLGLGDLETEMPGRARNVHFEEQVADDDTMTFDYKLRDGIVRSSNALRLMKIVGLDVVD